MERDLEGSAHARRWLTIGGLVGTFVWVGVASFVLLLAEPALEQDKIGTILSGWVAPIALLWLVLGYAQQNIELHQNGRALRMQAQELKNAVEQFREQVKALQSSGEYQKADVSIKMYDKLLADLSMRATSVFYRAEKKQQDPLDDIDKGILKDETNILINAHWERFAAGDRDVMLGFVRRYLDSHNIENLTQFQVHPDVRQYVRRTMQVYVEEHDAGLKELDRLKVPDFMMSHFRNGAPFTLRQRFERILGFSTPSS